MPAGQKNMSVRPVQKKGEGTGGIGPRAGRKVNGTIVMMRDITIRGIPRVTRLAIRSRVIRMKIIWQPGENPGRENTEHPAAPDGEAGGSPKRRGPGNDIASIWAG